MLALSQWQPALGVCPQETVHFQALPSHPPIPSIGPLYSNFNTMLSSGLNEGSSEGHRLQVISDRREALPDPPSVTCTTPIATADMLPVGQRAPTSEDWKLYRSTIIRLYRDEDRTLKDVMQILRTQYKFHATVKMYKSRLATWDVRKYMTWAERETACRVLKQGAGETSGKVIVRGKERNYDVFLRHMGQSRSGIRRRQLLQNSKRLEDIVIDSVKVKQLGSQIWPTLYPAGPRRNVEIVCQEMSSLVLTTMMSGLISTEELYRLLCVGHDRFNRNRPAEVRVLLNRAATCFSDAFGNQPAEAVLSLLKSQAIIGAGRLYASELLACFYRHLVDLARERYGPQHSLTKLLMHVLRMENDFDMRKWMYQSVLAVIISNLKERRTPDISQWYLNLAESLEVSGQIRQAEGVLLDAVNSLERETSRKDTAKVLCNFELALHYIWYQREMDDEAERILIDILEAGTDEVTGEVDPYHAYHANFGLGLLAEKRGEEDAAVNFYHLRLQAAYDQWGLDAGVGLDAVGYLAKYLWSLGREEEAIEAESLMKLTDEFSKLDLE